MIKRRLQQLIPLEIDAEKGQEPLCDEPMNVQTLSSDKTFFADARLPKTLKECLHQVQL